MDEVRRLQDRATRWRASAWHITDAATHEALLVLADAADAAATARWAEIQGKVH